MIPSFFLHRPFLPIASDRLILRPLEENDAVPMTALANDIRIAEKLARLPYPYTVKDAHEFISYSQEGIKKGEHLNLAVIRRADQMFMGIVGLEEEVGYWLGFEFWGQGYGKEAMKALVHFAFFTLQQKKLTARARADNIASRRIFEGLGFIQIKMTECTSCAYEGTKPGVVYTLSREAFIENYNGVKRPLVWVVAGTLINEEGKLLVAERPAGKNLAGVWELPGGKMEPGEIPEETLIRELKEELHIDVQEAHLEPLTFASYRYETFHLIMPIYLSSHWEGNLHGAEGQKLAWITYKDLARYPLPAADILPAHRLADILKERNIWI